LLQPGGQVGDAFIVRSCGTVVAPEVHPTLRRTKRRREQADRSETCVILGIIVILIAFVESLKDPLDQVGFLP
jgi:hypothetical protein